MPTLSEKKSARPTKRSAGRPLPELIFGDLWEFDPAPETADPKLKPRYELFIGGKFVAPQSGKYFDTINPATEQKLAEAQAEAAKMPPPADPQAARAAAEQVAKAGDALAEMAQARSEVQQAQADADAGQRRAHRPDHAQERRAFVPKR